MTWRILPKTTGFEAPADVRWIAWFYLTTAVLGFIAAAVDLAQVLMNGGILNLSVGIGISGWAIGRGLLNGSHRAWKWARRLALIGSVGVVLFTVIVFSTVETATVTFPWAQTTVEAWDPKVLVMSTLMAFFFYLQFRRLSNPDVRALYASEGPSER